MRSLLLLLSGCGRLGFDPLGFGSNIDAPHAVVDAPVFALDAGQCPPNYAFVAPSCYRKTTALDWLAAELECEADAAGAHLVVIDDDAEQQMVKTLGLTNDTWIGCSKRSKPWRTVVDTPAYVNLGPNQTELSEDCMSLDSEGVMYIRSCTDRDAAFCEYDGIPAVPAAY
jgi:hypothetical protein